MANQQHQHVLHTDALCYLDLGLVLPISQVLIVDTRIAVARVALAMVITMASATTTSTLLQHHRQQLKVNVSLLPFAYAVTPHMQCCTAASTHTAMQLPRPVSLCAYCANLNKHRNNDCQTPAACELKCLLSQFKKDLGGDWAGKLWVWCAC